jgi:hypothetical protein
MVLQPVQITPDTACLIEHDEIGCLPSQRCNQSTGTFFGGQRELNDSVPLNLFDLIDSRPLQMRPEKLTEGWRCRWIPKSSRGEVQTGGFLVAREEKSMRAARRTNLQHYRTISRLVNFLNPSAGQDGRDLFHDCRELCHSQRHNLSISPCFVDVT